MKKKLLSLLLALVLISGLSVPSLAAGGFADVDANAYYAEAVDWAVEKGITVGTSDTTFSPERTCTRGEIITFLWRAAGSPEAKYNTTILESPDQIQDIKPGDFFYKAVLWAKEQEAFEGNLFQPRESCTRLMAVEFICSCNKYSSISTRALDAGFSDASSPAVNWAVAWGIVKGTGENTFSPEKTCTRGQIVTMLHRYDTQGPSTHDAGGTYFHELDPSIKLEMNTKFADLKFSVYSI